MMSATICPDCKNEATMLYASEFIAPDRTIGKAFCKRCSTIWTMTFRYESKSASRKLGVFTASEHALT